ncbi:MAG: glycosyltransferase [Anaerolineae bacterium]|nr:glycosyltransferase [Anaerolineae bacterium]
MIFPPRRRFLFLYSTTGAGHRAAALAIRDALHSRYGSRAEVTLCDALQALRLWPLNRFPRWWPFMVRLRGVPWGVFYRLTNAPALQQMLARLLLPLTGAAVERLLLENPADVVVSLHPLFTHTFGRVLRRRVQPAPLISVVLDLVSIHAAWCSPDCVRIFVPTPQAVARAFAWGIPPERLECAGLPIHPRFVATAQLEPADVRAQLGLPIQGPVILVAGGGDAGGPVFQVIRAVAARSPEACLVVITGNNTRLRQVLAEQTRVVRVEGFVENMDMWMRAADVLLTKAGPNTIAEALVMGLPMVLYHAIPGQEKGNVEWLLSQGAGFWAPDPKRAATAITTLLNEPRLRTEMSAAARALARPAAAMAIGEALWELADQA